MIGNFIAFGSGSGTLIPMQILIQENLVSADPDPNHQSVVSGSVADPEPYLHL
jgi:hypothetical protein